LYGRLIAAIKARDEDLIIDGLSSGPGCAVSDDVVADLHDRAFASDNE
jgi:hypothetical protein